MGIGIIKGIGTERLIFVIKEKVEEKFGCDKDAQTSENPAASL